MVEWLAQLSGRTPSSSHGGYVVVAFQADNPGYWIMHCHIEEHLIKGMAVIIQEYSPGQQLVPPEEINLHGSFEWTIDEYRETLSRSEFCNATNVPSTPAAAPIITNSPGEISVSVVGFGFAMAIIAILFIAVLIMTVVIILLCLKKISPYSVTEEHDEGEFSMSEIHT